MSARCMVTSLNAEAAAGHTISYTTKNGASPIDTTHYVLDAAGNIMAVYRNKKIEEQPIYGSARIGEYAGKEKEGYQTFNLRKYELTNHLGNVLAVISDKVNLYGHDNRLDSARATIASASDYYPFGLIMQGRTYQDSVCRYGFNGKRKNNRYGRIAKYNYGFRIYSPEDGVFLSVDPLTKSFPWYTPYQFAGNSPILHIDLDGLEEVNTMAYWLDNWCNSRQLKKTEWLSIDRILACASFAEAVAYNTMKQYSGLYQPINQIHNYYQWADETLTSKEIDIKWFSAAEEVTVPFFGIGASQHKLGQALGGFSNDASGFLSSGNGFLFKKNMGMMKNILETRSFNGETGVYADRAMVREEQKALSEFMKNYEDKVGSKKFDEIIDNINKSLNSSASEMVNSYIKSAKEKIGGEIDFRNQSHREALGNTLVDQKRSDEKKK